MRCALSATACEYIRLSSCGSVARTVPVEALAAAAGVDATAATGADADAVAAAAADVVVVAGFGAAAAASSDNVAPAAEVDRGTHPFST